MSGFKKLAIRLKVKVMNEKSKRKKRSSIKLDKVVKYLRSNIHKEADEVAKLLGVSKACVYQAGRQLDYKFSQPESKADKIKKLEEGVYTTEEIAKMLGTSASYVRKLCGMHGIKTKPPESVNRVRKAILEMDTNNMTLLEIVKKVKSKRGYVEGILKEYGLNYIDSPHGNVKK